MLKLEPAILYQEELKAKYIKFQTSNKSLYYNLSNYVNYELTIEQSTWSKEQYAITDYNYVVGYLCFFIDNTEKIITNIALVMFSEDSMRSAIVYKNIENKIHEYFNNGFIKIKFSSVVGSISEKINDKIITRFKHSKIVGIFENDCLLKNNRYADVKYYEIQNK